MRLILKIRASDFCDAKISQIGIIVFVSKTLAGFKSRWTTPMRWAVQKTDCLSIWAVVSMEQSLLQHVLNISPRKSHHQNATPGSRNHTAAQCADVPGGNKLRFRFKAAMKSGHRQMPG
jgi:hypothetical protein